MVVLQSRGGVSNSKSPRSSRSAAMHCFRFPSWERERDGDERRVPATTGRSLSARSTTSSTTTSTTTDPDVRRSASECCSLNASELSSAGSLGRCRQLSVSSSQRPPNALRVFTFQELRSATRGFSRAQMLGEGGFGCVYRGTVRSAAGGAEPRRSIDVAIKQLGRKGLQGHKEWMTEVNVLGVVEHANLVKLIGYCAEDDERGMQLLLVYEFMPNGSLSDHLSARSPRPASWAMRLRVALDTARGLKYLHEESEFKVRTIHSPLLFFR